MWIRSQDKEDLVNASDVLFGSKYNASNRKIKISS